MKEVEIIDLSAEQPRKAVVGRSGKHRYERDRNGLVLVRKPSEITGITLHQTACVFGPKNNPAAKHRRALTDIAAHVTAFQDGTVVQGNPLTWYVWHANKLNSRSLGLECEGIFDAVRIGNREQLTDLMLATFCAGLKYLVDKGRKEGMPIKYLWCHRQSHPMKPGDPGWEIYQKVGSEFGVNALGLEMRIHDTFGEGRPIPKQWDPKATAPYT